MARSCFTLLVAAFKQRTLWMMLLLIALTTTAFAQPIPSSQPALSENQAKAALLYNFMKHTQWPNENGITQFHVHFLGNEKTFYNEFNTIAKEVNIRDKKIVTSKSALFDSHASQNVLVLSSANNEQLKDISAAHIRSGTLIISDNAKDQKLVMINFTYPKQDALSFEINKSNIVYEGLKISNDVLLHGGTEIEVATLYKEMESLLGKIKEDVEHNKKDLKLKQEEINNRQEEITNKNAEILLLKSKTDAIGKELNAQTALFNEQQEKLRSFDEEITKVKNSLNDSKKLLSEREQLVKALEIEISQKQNTLKQQEQKINNQQKLVAEKSEKVTLLSTTISSQRNIIYFALFLLLIFLLVIIIRQKQALIREHQLLETRAQLIKAQTEAIEAYESSLKLKNDFLIAISHEMRTPMNGIIGAVQIINPDDAGSLPLALEIINKSSTDMLTLVDDILTYIEIQSGQIKPTPEPVAIQKFFDSLRQHYLPLCQTKGLTLNWHISNKIAPWINLDHNKLAKILEKLLDNAVKFTEYGSITVIVQYDSSGEKGQLTCTIKDTGIGISKETQQHIFDTFWQEDSGLTRRYNGLGIGLTICQKLITSLDGKMDIVSSKDTGSTFTVTLDVTETEAPVAIHPTDNPQTNAPILIVEDNPINQEVLKLMLNKLGYECVITNDGIEGLAALEHFKPCLIFMDLQMPRMDGLSCARAIRQRTDDFKNIPIVAISANMMESQQQSCYEAGMNRFLSKPVEIAQLKQAISQYVHTLDTFNP